MRLKNVEDVYTLAPIQQGILFHMLYASQSEVYFSQFICTIDQRLDVEAFRLAWQQVLVRHPALRTAFLWEGLDEPLQVVNSHVELSWKLLDWQEIPVAEQEAHLETFLAADRARGFDLTTAPLLRLYLIQTAEQTYTFISSSPHLLMDGWSRALVLKEVSASYEALVRGQTPRLPRVRPYRDYIGWLQHHNLAETENYWRRELKGFTNPTTVGTTKAPGGEQKPVYASCELRLSIELTATLHRLSRQHQLTLNTLVQGAWSILLSRYSGEQDIVFGVTVAGRPASLPGAEAMVGLFINTLPWRVDVQPDTPLIPWLKRLQEQQAIMLEYQHAPLVQIQSWSELPREQQLFESILVFENTLSAVSWEPANELQFRDMRGGVEETNYPLTLIVGPESELLLRVLYDTNLFEPGAVVSMLEHLRNALASMVAMPTEHLKDLSILSTDEQRVLLHDWNQTQRAYPAEQCIHTLFEDQVLKSPDAVALMFEDQMLTYQELSVQANQLAWHLRQHGTGPEIHIAICMDRCLELIVGILGILKAGRAYVPLDPDYPVERLSFMLKDAQVRLLITQRHLLDLFPDPGTDIICMDAVAAHLSEYSPVNLPSDTNAQNLAYIMYTSGSTGWPKGVEIRHQSIARLVFGADYVQLDSKRAILQLSPVAFDASTFEIWGALLHGGRCVLYPERIPTTLGIGAAVRTQGVNTLWLTASLFNVVIQEEPDVLRGLTQLLIGGEALSVPHVRLGLKHLPTTQIINGYGPTESTTFTCCYHIAVSLRENTQSIPIGRPIANTQVYVLDQHLHPVPVGVAGILYIGGSGLARGYLNHPELTAERFVPDPFSGQPGTRLYCTGDLVRYAADGYIEFLGRVDQQVKLRGFRIEPGEIEAVLRRHPEVREAAVMVFGESPTDKQLVAYVVPRPEYAPSPDQLRLFLEPQLPAYMLPSTFVLLERFPLNPNGKLDRRALPVPAIAVTKQDAVSVAARNPVEELLMAQWAEMLGVEQIGIHDNFFELGGHSLLATQAVSRLYKMFHVELPLRTFFESATISAIASHITSMAEKELQAPALIPVHRPATLPLSFAQQRLWFLHQLEPTSILYNIRAALSLRGNFYARAFERSVQEIVQRHESLRTTFSAVDGLPQQYIAATLTLPLPVVDLQTLTTAEQQLEVQLLALQEAQIPFDFVRGPLLRLTLLRLAPQEHVLLLTIHHIVFDEWSLEVFGQELSKLYNAYVQGEPSPLPELPVQYADFVLWQREWLQGEALQAYMDYWRKQLRGIPAVLPLPTDRPRPARQTFHGGSVSFNLAPELSHALKALSLREGSTLFMTLLAAFTILLARYSGQDDVVVGSPIANRTRIEMENLLGFFVNTLVLRTDVSGNPTFQDILHRVREVALEAYTHQNLPFEKLVEEFSPERDLSRNPLFQVMFVLQHVSESVFDLADLTLRPIPVEVGTTQFDLTLSLLDGAQGIEGRLSYNRDLFEESTIARMADHFQTLLQGIIISPTQPIGTLSLLTDIERQQQLVTWNATQTNYPRNLSLHEMVEAQVVRSLDRVAVVFEDHHLSYDCLNEQANQLAHRLQHLGVGTEARVGVCLQRSLELVVSLLAILKAGGAYVPLEPTYPPERLRWLLHDSQATAVITQTRWLARLAPLSTPVLCLDSQGWTEQGERRQHNPCSGVGEQNQAYVIYTSGSTGQPKGVINTHQGICNRLLWMQECYGLTASDRVLQKTPFSFDVSVWEFFWPLLSGACLVVARPESHRESAYLVQLIEREQISTLHFVPSMLSALLEEPGWERCQHLRSVICSGEELTSSVQQRFFARCQAELSNLYGPTEAAIDVTFWRCRRDDERLIVPIGRPIANIEVYVLDNHLQPVPVGVSGELYLGGIGLARGYLNRPELTAERFIPHPWGQESGARLYRTGDRACYLPDGAIRFLGRRDSQVKIRGFRIEPGEVEAILAGHTEIREVAVLARDDMPGGRGLVVYIVPVEEEAFSSQDLHAYAQERLPEYMVPAAFVKMATLPTTANGKLDRQRLPLPTWSGLNQVAAEPMTENEKLLAGIWEEVLGIKGIGIHTNFFDVGGDSILSMLIIARAREAGLYLTPRQIFQHQTIAGLAAIAQADAIFRFQDRGTEPNSVHDAEREPGFVPLLAMQHWFFAQHFPEPWHWNQAVCLEIASPHIVPALLQQTIVALVERHGAMRLRFTHDSEGWKQFIAQTEMNAASLLSILDVSQKSLAEQNSAFAEATTSLQSSLNLEIGPLLRALYVIRSSSQPDLLVIGIHHLAVDVVSWRILLDELRTIYSQLERGMPVQLPTQTSSFKRWCESLHTYTKSPELLQEVSYWLAQKRQNVPPLPLDFAVGWEANTEASQDHVSLSLDFEETRELLQDVPGVYHTQINEVLLTALLLTCAPWVGQYRLLVNLEGHGREGLFDTIDISRTVGWFTSMFPVLLDLTHLIPSPLSNIDLGQTLKTIKEEVRDAPRHGIGYGVLRYMGDRAMRDRLAALPQAQMSFNYVGQFTGVQDNPYEELFRPVQADTGPLRSRQGHRSHVLDVSGLIADGQFQINWSFSRNLHRHETIEMLAGRYLEMLRSLIAHCRFSGAGGYTPSDFPELGISQARLDKVLSKLNSRKKE